MSDPRLRELVEKWDMIPPWAQLTILVVVIGWKIKRRVLKLLAIPAVLLDRIFAKINL